MDTGRSATRDDDDDDDGEERCFLATGEAWHAHPGARIDSIGEVDVVTSFLSDLTLDVRAFKRSPAISRDLPRSPSSRICICARSPAVSRPI